MMKDFFFCLFKRLNDAIILTQLSTLCKFETIGSTRTLLTIPNLIYICEQGSANEIEAVLNQLGIYSLDAKKCLHVLNKMV